MAEFNPTVNEDREIGGAKNFGSSSFIPNITNVTGTYKASGVYQRMGKLLFWAFELTGTSTTTSSVFTPPIAPQRISAAANYKAGEIAHVGDGVQSVNGTYAIANATVTDGVRRLSGWYWTK